MMKIWHDTVDAPRTPRRVSPGQQVDMTVGTWPIAPGQAVWITWDAVSLDGNRTEGTTAAHWQRNTEVNSYRMARLDPFAEGDQVSYTVHGSSSDGSVQTAPVSLRVRPLYIAWLWHQHQPLYRDPAAPNDSGSYRYPWVRLHAIRDGIGSLERVEMLVAVGGVMAGARRFQITLGPFPAPTQRLVFRFNWDHAGCKHESPCCLSGPQEIRFDRTRRRTPQKASADSSHSIGRQR